MTDVSTIDRDVRHAVAREQLSIEFQPIFRLASGNISGCEALARWNHPDLGRVSPAQFIAAAEANRSIIGIGAWVLGEACREAAGWPAQIRVAVNVSVVQLRNADFIPIVQRALDEHRLAPSRLELEITESVLVDDSIAMGACIEQLRAMGIRIALDDFGTGFCSLAYLQRLKFDKIKIDRLFTQSDLQARAVLRAITRLGNMLSVSTTAEGVETAEQLDFVKFEGCTEAQGFLLGKPQSPQVVNELLWASVDVDDDVPEALPVKPAMERNESNRLKALYDYNVLDSQAEESFDRITRIAMQTLDAPIAMVSLIDGDRQWFKSRQGCTFDETVRSISFCAHTIEGTGPLVVRDATEDPRFNSSPLVTGSPGIRSYVGVPLRTPGGHNIGALCIKDTRPRDVSADQIAILEDLGRLVIDELELRKLAVTDGLTGALTHKAFTAMANKEVDRWRRNGRDAGCIILDIDHFKSINDRYGHAAGDAVLHEVVAKCSARLRSSDIFGRIGGEEFAVFLPDSPRDVVVRIAESLRELIASTLVAYGDRNIRVTASCGVTSLSPRDVDIKDALARADSALYAAKRAGRNCVRVDFPAAALPSANDLLRIA